MRRGFQRLAKLALFFAVLDLAVNLGLLALLFARSPFFFALALDNTVVTGFLCMCSACLGLAVFYRRRWPGDSVHLRALRPGRGDLALASVALLLCGVNIVMYVIYMGIVFRGR